MKISATIITFNEESNVAKAIKSLSFVDEIIVVDSHSTDRTIEIAKDLGAKVLLNKFAGYGQQKNFAASQCSTPWVLNIDADEEVTETLKNSILQTVNSGPEETSNIYYLQRMTQFCGQWIKHGGWFPDNIGRLYKKDHAHWTEPQVHEKLVTKIDRQRPKNPPFLKGLLKHYSFPTVLSQVQTNIKYARLGSKQLTLKNKSRPHFSKIILKPLGKFIECYILKKGLLDGKAGLIIAMNAAYSIFLKYTFAFMDKEDNPN